MGETWCPFVHEDWESPIKNPGKYCGLEKLEDGAEGEPTFIGSELLLPRSGDWIEHIEEGEPKFSIIERNASAKSNKNSG